MYRGNILVTGLLAVLLPSVTAAAERRDRLAAAPTISRDTSLRVPFAAAVAMVGSRPTAARREFQQMLAGHPDRAILHWGLTKTTGDAAQRRSEWLNAVYLRRGEARPP